MAPLPAPPANVAGAQEATKKYCVFAGFQTMDTQSARQALPNQNLAWCENLQIVGPNQLVCVNGPMSPLQSLAGESISVQYFANFTPPGGVNTDYIISFCQSGAAYQTNIATGATVKFANAGTFSSAPDMTVWASQRILIADPVSGYASWDGNALVRPGGVSPNFTITNGGSGYGSPPTVTISGGSGSGAAAHAIIVGGVVTAIVLDSAGTGYKPADTLTVSFSPASTTAATANVWPQFSGLTPTTLAVYAGRVWLAGTRVLQWTGTKGYDDAASANAAGSTTLTDADLVHFISALRNFNNFLYIFGDNSVKQIGTVTVSGSVTIFNIVTLSSDQGTTFKNAIASYNRLVVFANKVGIYAVLGASIEKISDPMDGIFASIDYTQPLQAAVTDMHTALHTFLLLCRYKDPILGVTRSLIICFYKNRWFVCNQGNNITTICTAPVAGIIETFCSSGNDITQIFQSTTPVPIILRTSLSINQDLIMGKKALHIVVALFSNLAAIVNGTLDTENLNPGKPFTFNTSNQLIWINNANQILTWQNNSLQTLTWVATGFIYLRVPVEGAGVFLGATLQGNFSGGAGGGGTAGSSTGFVLNSLFLEYQDRTAMSGKMSV